MSKTEKEIQPLISDEERCRRIKAVEYARGNMRLSGFTISEESEALNRQYIEGTIATIEEYIEATKMMVEEKYGKSEERKTE